MHSLNISKTHFFEDKLIGPAQPVKKIDKMIKYLRKNIV